MHLDRGVDEVRYTPRKLSPTRLRRNAFADGFQLFFESGFAFRLTSLAAPYLTWSEGSTGHDVVAAPSKAVVISFRDGQPPILLSFPDSTTTMKVDGKPGNWVLRSGNQFSGWVRVILPTGLAERPTTDAASLGRLWLEVSPHLPRWTQPPARISRFSAERDHDGLTAHLEFDRAGATLPAAWVSLVKAAEGSRRVRVRGSIGVRSDTPDRWLKQTKLDVILPDARTTVGRALTADQAPTHRPTITEWQKVVDLAFASMLSTRTEVQREFSLNLLNAFAPRFTPAPNPQMAAFTLLGQVVAPVRREPWLAGAADLVTWGDWSLDQSNQTDLHRSTALYSLALGLSDVPERQFLGAMLDAELCESERSSAFAVARDARDQLFAKEALVGCFNSPFRILTMQSAGAHVKDSQLILDRVALGTGEEFAILLPKSVGPTRNGFIRLDDPQADASKWVGKAEKAPLTLEGRFGPIQGSLAAPMQYRESGLSGSAR